MSVVGELAQLESLDEDQTLAMGSALGRLLRPGHVVGLVGELGAGKTRLAAGVAEGAGVPEHIYVSSPTFTLINEYPGRDMTLVHMDFYRLAAADELVELGVDEYYQGTEAACLVEWFDRFPEAAPECHLRVEFEVCSESARLLRLAAAGDDHRQLGRAWWAALQQR